MSLEKQRKIGREKTRENENVTPPELAASAVLPVGRCPCPFCCPLPVTGISVCSFICFPSVVPSAACCQFD